MLGYNSYDDGALILLKTVGWLLLLGSIFGIYLLYCGLTTYYARDGELIGQAKKLTMVTPFWSSFCPTYYAFDVSLGVIQNGVGSLSKQDVVLTVTNTADLEMMKSAIANGSLVRVKYDTRRLAFCTENHISTGFSLR